MITFSDILKGKFLEEFSAIAPGEMLTAIALAFVLSLFILLIYRVSYAGVSFSWNFAGCLVMICMVTSVVIQVITSNIVLSLGMVGALSIVRFRTAVKEPADTAFLFWAIATGILCGAGYVTVSVLATLVLGLLFVAVYALGRKPKTGNYLVILRWDGTGEAEAALTALPGFRLKNKTITAQGTELVAEVRLNSLGMEKLSALRDFPGVREITVMQSVTGTGL